MLLRQFNWPRVPLCITALIIFEVSMFKAPTVGWVSEGLMPPPFTETCQESLRTAAIEKAPFQ